MSHTKHSIESHEVTSHHSPTPKVQLLMAPEHKNQKEVKELLNSPSVGSQSPTPKLLFAGPTRAIDTVSGYCDERDKLVTQSEPMVGLPLEIKIHSSSPDAEQVTQTKDKFEKSPIWLQTPMLEGPLAFKPEVLKHWGCANTDHSEYTMQFQTQLHEWRNTKIEL